MLFVLSSDFRMKGQSSIPKVSSGKIERIENFKSSYVTSRNIEVWLPENYSHNEKYAVLYMHDGQMLFDSSITWNKQSWEMDRAGGKLHAKNKSKKFIVVGIWNDGKNRHQDYFPQKPFEMMSMSEQDTINIQLKIVGRTEGNFHPQSDVYLKFIVEELKPFIESKYSVFTNKENTFIMGSSMGGLISLYAICEYPEVFGAAACISTHWPGTFTLSNNPFPGAMKNYLKMYLPDPNSHRIYFDCGDKTLDALYPNIQQDVDVLMRKKGFKKKNSMSKYFSGEDHSERAWAKRVEIPLQFLMKK